MVIPTNLVKSRFVSTHSPQVHNMYEKCQFSIGVETRNMKISLSVKWCGLDHVGEGRSVAVTFITYYSSLTFSVHLRWMWTVLLLIITIKNTEHLNFRFHKQLLCYLSQQGNWGLLSICIIWAKTWWFLVRGQHIGTL